MHGGSEEALQDKRKCDWHLLNGSVLFRQMCEGLMSRERESEGEGERVGKWQQKWRRERESKSGNEGGTEADRERERCRGSLAAPID